MLDGRVRARTADRAAPLIFAVAVAVMPFAASAQSPLPAPGQPLVISSEASPAKRATVGAPRQVDLRAVPQITAKELAAAAARPQLPRPRTLHTEQQYAAFKAQAAQLRFEIPNLKPLPLLAAPAAGSIATEAGTEGVLTPLATTSFSGNTQAACSFVPALGHTVTPADMALAVGDTNVGVVQVNNVCISVFDKAGIMQAGYPKPLPSLVGLNPLTTCVSDPRALYDWVNHRYIIAFLQLNCANLGPGGSGAPSSYWVAVSAADDPTGVYHGYNIFSGFGANVAADFPRLGQDRQAIYLASNVFTADLTGYFGEEWLLLPKGQMYAGGSLFGLVNDIGNPLGAFLDSSQPANVWSPTDNPRAEFFVTSLNSQGGFYFDCLFTAPFCSGLIVWAVSNPLVIGAPGPEISAVLVPTSFPYAFPPGAVQLGGAGMLIDTNDVRISGEVTYVAGSLYAALTSADGTGGAGSFLYRIQPTLNANDNAHCPGSFQNLCPDITGAAIISENFLFGGGGGNSVYFATQQPDPEGNATTVFNFSGPGNWASTGYISSRVTQGVGAFVNNFAGPGILLQQGLHTYTQGCFANPINGQTVCRWGDYTAVAPAGIGGSTPSPKMWFAGMSVDSSGNWTTAVGKNGFTAPNQP